MLVALLPLDPYLVGQSSYLVGLRDPKTMVTVAGIVLLAEELIY